MRNSIRLTQLAIGLALALSGRITSITAHESVYPVGQPSTLNANGTVVPVLNCNDDNSPGSLRSVITAAADGATIDLSGLTCGVITLTQGELPINQVSLSLVGPPVAMGVRPSLVIDGNYNGRVLHAQKQFHASLALSNLEIANGLLHVPDGTANGGCILAQSLTLENVIVSNCQASGQAVAGGGIATYRSLSISNSMITFNRAIGAASPAATGYITVWGGGIYNGGGYFPLESDSVSISGSTISNNTATIGINGSGAQTFAGGGGLWLSHFVPYDNRLTDITRSTISGNAADTQSGGVEGWGDVAISNTTISGNNARYAGGMSALQTYLTLQSSTIAFNSSYLTGGVIAPAATMTMNSTIIANNTATNVVARAVDLAGEFSINAAGDNNLVVDLGPEVAFSSPQMNADPQLLPLANNGGPTQTHALAFDSPAICKGNNAAGLLTDQRGAGFQRSLGGMTDVGAFERSDRIFADQFE